MVDDSEEMESEQIFLEVFFYLVERIISILFDVLTQLHPELYAVLEHHNVEPVNIGHAGTRFQGRGDLQQAVLGEHRAEVFESEVIVVLLEAFDRDVPPFVVALVNLPVRSRSH